MISIQNNDQFVNRAEIGDVANENSNLQLFITIPDLTLNGDYMIISVAGPDNSTKYFFHILQSTDIVRGYIEIPLPTSTIKNDAGEFIDGEYALNLRVANVSGASTTYPGNASFVLDTIAPTTAASVDILDGGDGFLNQDELAGLVKIAIGIPDDAKVGYIVEVDVNGDGFPDATHVITAADIGKTVEVEIAGDQFSINNNSVAANVTIKDQAGNISEVAADTSLVDNAAPNQEITISAISDDTGFNVNDFSTNDTSLTVQGELSKILSATERVEVSNDGGVTWHIAEVVGSVWQFVDADNHPDNFIYTARVIDAVGNIGNVVEQNIRIDTTAPTQQISITSITTDSGENSTDYKTSDTTLTLNGNLDQALSLGDKVQVSSDNGASWELATVNGTSWSFQDEVIHSADFTYQARVIDNTGNVGNEVEQNIIIDITAPAQIIDITAITTDSGLIDNDFITNDTSLTVSGTLNESLQVNERIEVSNDGGSTWQVATVNALTWAFNDPEIHNSSFNYDVRIIDDVGNVGDTDLQTIVIDNDAPNQLVTITAISDDSGVIGDFKTNDTTLTLSGNLSSVLEANSRVQVSNDGGATWETAETNGLSWSLVDPDVHNSNFVYSVRVIDVAGNTGNITTQNIIIDTTAPDDSITINITAITDDTGTPNDFKTSDTSLTVSGTLGAVLGANDKVEVSNDGGQTWVEANVTGTTWSLVDATNHSTDFTYQARVIDHVGNVGESDSQDIVIITGGPDDSITIAITAITDDTGIANDFKTSDTSLTVSGTLGAALGANDRVEVSNDGGQTWIEASVTGTTWSLVDSTIHSTDFTYQARVIDDVGNIGESDSQNIIIDTTAPDDSITIAITAITDDTGIANDFKTSDTSLTVSGTLGAALGANDRVEVSNDGGQTWIEASVTGTTWSLVDSTIHSTDFTYQARVIDHVGNVGENDSQNIIIDTTAPDDSITIEITAITDDTGIANDFKTSDTSLTVSGTLGAVLGANDKVEVSNDGGQTWIEASVTGTTWILVDATNHSTDFTYQARVIDHVGNVGQSDSQNIVIDTTAPDDSITIDITAITDDTGTPNDFKTSDTSLTVSGTLGAALGANDRVEVSNDGGQTWVEANVTGTTWNLVDATDHSTSFTYQARVVDHVGNVGESDSQDIVIVTGGPDASITIDITAITDDTGIANDFKTSDTSLTVSGVLGAELGGNDRVEVSNDGGQTWVEASVTGTTWSLVDVTDHSTSFTYQARVIDHVGNVGQSDSQNIVIDTTAPDDSITIEITAITDDTGIANDFKTSDTSLTVSGTLGAVLGANDKVEVSNDGGQTWIEASVTGTTWILVDATNHSTDFTYQARVIDHVGNVGQSDSQNIVIDTTAPDDSITIEITAITDDTGIANDFKTSDTSLTVSGTLGAELGANDRVEVSNDGGQTWVEASVTGTTWSLVDVTDHSTSFTYQARVIDHVGNVGESDSQNIVIVTGGPDASITIDITAITDDTGIANDFKTSDTSLTVSGTLGAVLGTNDRVEVSSDGGQTWVEASVTGTTWSLADSTIHSTDFTYQARVIDHVGIVGESDSQNIVIDTTAPDDSIIIDITAITDDTGIANDFKTSDTSLTVSGTLGAALGANDRVEVSNDGGQTWVEVSVTGTTWSLVDTTVHSTNFTYQARVIDHVGNVGEIDSQNVVIDTTGPDDSITIDITAITDDTGIANDFKTSDTSLTVSGTLGAVLGANDKVEVSNDGGQTWIEASVTGTTWILVDATNHSTDFTYQARVIDHVGNVGESDSQNIVIDTTAPDDSITIEITAITDDTGIANDFKTSDTSLTVSGILGAELGANDRVEVSSDGGQTWVEASVTGTTWSLVDSTIHSTDFTYQARVIDHVGIVGESDSQNIVIDTTAPDDSIIIDITAITDDTGIANDFKTSDTSLTVSGTLGAALGANDRVEVSNDGGQTWVEVSVTGTTWSLVDTTVHSTNFTYQARVIDHVGNVGEIDSQNVVIDTTGPDDSITIDITAITDDTGIANDFKTSDTSLTVSGTLGAALGANDRVEVSSDGGQTWLEASVTGMTWSLVDATNHSTDFTYQARVIDHVGNVGESDSQNIVIDTTAPDDSITIDITAITDDTGIANDFKTSDTSLTVSGTLGAELGANDRVEVSSDGGQTWVEASVTGTTWSLVDSTIHSTDFTYQARVIDHVGNVGESDSQNIVIDTTAPDDSITIDITAISDDTGTPNDFKTSDTSLTVSGTLGAELGANDRIEVSSDGGQTWVEASVTGTAWSLADTTIHSTDFTYQARVIDHVGNIGESDSQNIVIDTTAPDDSITINITAISDDTGIPNDFQTSDTSLTVSGTLGAALGANDRVEVSNDGGQTWVEASVTGLTWSLVDAIDHSTNFTYQARVIDHVDNVGESDSQNIVIVTGGPDDSITIEITAISDDTGVANDFKTSDTSLTVSGTLGAALGANDRVEVSNDGGQTWVEASVTGTTWSLVDTVDHPTNFTYQARVVDTADNVGKSDSQAIIIDTTNPDTVTVDLAARSDSTLVGLEVLDHILKYDDFTIFKQLEFDGNTDTVEVGSIVYYYAYATNARKNDAGVLNDEGTHHNLLQDSNNQYTAQNKFLLGTAEVKPDGSWTMKMTDTQGDPLLSKAKSLDADGNEISAQYYIHVDAQIVDVAGNQSSFSSALKITIETTDKNDQTRDPLILDLDGDGIHTVSINDGVTFDHDGDGVKENSGWVSATDGLLVRDINNDGFITSGKELFGDQTAINSGNSQAADGYEALAALDSNQDNVINSLDDKFSELKVWIDADQDGITDSGELKSLAELGITELSLDYQEVSVDEFGNEVIKQSSFVQNNETKTLSDVNLAAGPSTGGVSFVTLVSKKELLGNADVGDGSGAASNVSIEVNVPKLTLVGEYFLITIDGPAGVTRVNHLVTAQDLAVGQVVLPLPNNALQTNNSYVDGDYSLSFVVATIAGAVTTYPGKATFTLDTIAPDAPLSVEILNGADNLLDQNELAGQVSIRIALPNTVQAGMLVNIDLNEDGSIDRTYTVTANDIGKSIDIEVAGTEFAVLHHHVRVQVNIVDQSGNIGESAAGASVVYLNTAPKAQNDSVSTDENTAININVLNNDTDIDGDRLTLDSIVQDAAHGQVSINNNGTITYTPTNDYSGTDSFVYKIQDGKGGYDTATVQVNVKETDIAKTAAIMGVGSISEGNSGYYKVGLSSVAAADTWFTVQVSDGSANRVDANGWSQASQDIMWGGYYSVGYSANHILYYVHNKVPNGTALSSGDRAMIGPKFATWDYTVEKNGAVQHGGSVQVLIRAGQTQSETFEIQTWNEKITTDNFIHSGSAGIENNENFTMRVTNVSGSDADNISSGASKNVYIQDRSDINRVSPLILDLDNDGVETIAMNQGVKFDLDADGDLDATGWVNKDDALLVRDLNDDGLINDGSELFGENTLLSNGEKASNGFMALADLDSNNDGVFDKNDALYNELQIWQDRNSDGISQIEELSGLLDAGIESISLNTEVVSEFSADNWTGLRSSWVDTHGLTRDIDDVWFSTEDNNRILDLSDLLESEEIQMDALEQYLHFEQNGNDLMVYIDENGGFSEEMFDKNTATEVVKLHDTQFLSTEYEDIMKELIGNNQIVVDS